MRASGRRRFTDCVSKSNGLPASRTSLLTLLFALAGGRSTAGAIQECFRHLRIMGYTLALEYVNLSAFKLLRSDLTRNQLVSPFWGQNVRAFFIAGSTRTINGFETKPPPSHSSAFLMDALIVHYLLARCRVANSFIDIKWAN